METRALRDGVPRHDFAPVRWGHLRSASPADPYRARGKPRGPASCPDCRAVFARGRWTWLEPPPEAKAVLCPACHRVRDQRPAGFLVMSGPRLGALHDELTNQLRNEERRENAEHPLERIMALNQDPGEWVVTTTDAHLARRLGEAVHRAHQGALTVQYNAEQRQVRVRWES